MTKLDIELCQYPTSRNGRALLSYLQEGGKITPLRSGYELGIVALSQECGRLRRLGWPVESKMIRTGTGKRVACYYLSENKYWRKSAYE